MPLIGLVHMLKRLLYTIGLSVGLIGPSLAEELSPVQVVTALYQAQEKSFNEGPVPLLIDGPKARQYFFNDIADILNGIFIGYDPLYQGQDAQITDMEIALNADFPPLQNTVMVDVRFRNFGEWVEMTYVLHRELADGGVWQVFDIEFDGGTLSALVSLAHTHPGGFTD